MDNVNRRTSIVQIALVGMLMGPSGRLCTAQDARSKPLEQWLAQLKDPDGAQRRAAVVALGAFGPDLTKAMISQVGELLKDPDQSVRHAAALSIGNFGPAAKACWRTFAAPSRMRRRL